ncbi:MAG: ornithine carbamoyltransferase [Nitrososphaerota archaeon]|nr:ornithine carbamoyltransferase [Nitrososphaerota archaeon]MDG7038378.1 ornithine carbamoyltransferase [Nitrososphaerota archaeon]MDG7039969.1 ornithine carbamoyltransferase [Nitrososphaerota archaeon]MDG7047331.1 ornithine carbamoyltransferase [Nitrososphaerota archaeon]
MSYVQMWKGRDFLNTNDFTQEEITQILDAADDLRNKYRSMVPTNYLPGRTIFLLFYNESLRTRNSFEAGMFQLGGHAHFVRANDLYTPSLPEDMVAYKTEAVSDVARVMSRFGQAIAIRIYGDAAKWIIGRGHKIMELFAKWSSIPVINMEDDVYHPTQALADMQAARTARPKLQGKKFVVSYAYSGGLKPLAVPQSEALITTQMGMDVVLAHPKGFELDDNIVKACKANAEKYGGSFEISYNMKEAFEGADFVYPKAWSPKQFMMPYGPKVDKDGANAYQNKYKDWIVNTELLEKSGKPYYMHCGPADRGQEVTDDVLDSYENSLYFDEAENRLHTEKAVMAMTMP